jgi:geranylgeranyl diphosphate synthase type II
MSLHAPLLTTPRVKCSRTDLRVLRGAIERRLRALAPAADETDPLVAAVRYALLAPGKRIRPFLVILAAQECGADALDALDAGCALEMVHAASLVLDDLPAMDDTPLRRGQPSTHVAFGEAEAILAGVALLSRAYSTVAETSRLDAATRCSLVTILARAVGTGGLATGQVQDLRGAGHSDLSLIADANHLKTGMLFVAAVEMAAVIARAPAHQLERLRIFAGHLGQAFQLLDDLLDGGDPSDAAGGEDAGKATLLSMLGESEVRQRLERHIAHALDELDPDGALARFVGQIFAPPGQSSAGSHEERAVS